MNFVNEIGEERAYGFLRLFIAIRLPAVVREEIGRAQGQLRRHSPLGAIRWTRPDQFHITLKHLGDVPSAHLTALENSMPQACAGFPAFQLSAQDNGFFPNERKPRVIWAGVSDVTGQLAELHRQIEVAVLPFAQSATPERFASHITLGRFKPGTHGTLDKLLKRAAFLNSRRFGSWQTTDVEIVRSTLTAAGALHTPLASYRLAGDLRLLKKPTERR